MNEDLESKLKEEEKRLIKLIRKIVRNVSKTPEQKITLVRKSRGYDLQRVKPYDSVDTDTRVFVVDYHNFFDPYFYLDLLRRTPLHASLNYQIQVIGTKNKLGDALRRNVYIYAGAEHPHAAQQPKVIKLNTIK